VPNQDQLAAAAWQQLAIIGGSMTKEDDITFNGNAWNIPAIYRDDLNSAASDIARLAASMSEQTVVERTFQYRPLDGAHATRERHSAHATRERHGAHATRALWQVAAGSNRTGVRAAVCRVSARPPVGGRGAACQDSA